MATYSQFLGSSVVVQYRVGDILLSASGTFVGDSGRSIFLEQHLEQRGKRNYFRWEIPYPYIHRIEAATEPAVEDAPGSTPAPPESDRVAAAAAGAGTSAPIESPFLSLPNRPKIA